MGQIWFWFWRFALGFVVLTCLWVITLRFVNPPTTVLMIQRGLTKGQSGEYGLIRHQWVRYENISDHLKRAAIASEDAHFMSHHGFDVKAIKEALDKNKKGTKVWGASTISQQTAKNVFLWPQRSWLRKGLEVYFTTLIEVFWSKKRILEVYLNMIETGDRVFGMEAAAQQYFGRPASEINQRQAALIVATLPNPRQWNPAKPTAYLNRRADAIIRYITHYEIP